ncbi:MAG: hypothetical protein WAL41_15065, partial [Mycobacterium sp.]
GLLTDPGSIITGLSPGDQLPLLVNIVLGAPVLLGLGDVGPLVTTVDALETVFGELTSGDPTQVLTALIDGPAYIADGFLNGTTSVDLPVLGDVSLFNGLLAPVSNLDVTIGTDVLNPLLPELLTLLGADPTLVTTLSTFLGDLPTGDLATITAGPFVGLIDALVNVIPQELASSAAATPGADLTGLLDPSTLLSGLDLGNLTGLLDPSTLLGDVTGLLPGLAADVPAQLAADLATVIPL